MQLPLQLLYWDIKLNELSPTVSWGAPSTALPDGQGKGLSCSTLMQPHVEYCMQFWAAQYSSDA